MYTFSRFAIKDLFFKAIIVFTLLFMLEWVILYSIKKLPMDETRHLLIWLPIIGIWIFYLLYTYKINSKAIIILSIIFLISGIYNNINILNEKKDLFPYKEIEKSNIDTVLTYGFSLLPLVAFENTKKVYNIDVPSFAKSFEMLNLPDEILLVSQDFSLDYYMEKYDSLIKTNTILFERYDIKEISRKESTVCFTYNNYCVSSQKNGFFLYKMTRKD